MGEYLKRILQNNILTLEYDTIEYSGLAIINISKNKDSFTLKNIFASSKDFNLEESHYIAHSLNKYYKDKFPRNYNVLVPIYFDCYNSDSLAPYPENTKRKFDTKIKSFNNKIFILNPVHIISYPIQH